MKEFGKPSLWASPPPPLEPSSSLPTVWVREIWVRERLLRGFCLGLISPVCSFFMVCCFFVFLFGFLLRIFWFGFLLRLLFVLLLCVSIWVSWKSSLWSSSSMELKFFILNLAQQNRVPYTRDVILLNSFENVLTNKIVWVLVLFWKKKKSR